MTSIRDANSSMPIQFDMFSRAKPLKKAYLPRRTKFDMMALSFRLKRAEMDYRKQRGPNPAMPWASWGDRPRSGALWTELEVKSLLFTLSNLAAVANEQKLQVRHLCELAWCHGRSADGIRTRLLTENWISKVLRFIRGDVVNDMNDTTPKIYLSRRNLLALLSKLDRDAAGDETSCAIIKHQQPSPAYKQSMKSIMVIAVQDEDYYSAQARPAGAMHPADEVKLDKPKTGVGFMPMPGGSFLK